VGKIPHDQEDNAIRNTWIARMPVPKMVKNGFNSVLQTSAGSRRLVAASIFV
jgi:hypothetical protein